MTHNEVHILQERWDREKVEWGIIRDYTPQDIIPLRGTLRVEHTLARHGAERLRRQLKGEDFIRTGGAYNGNDAVQMVQAGLNAIYLSGWQSACGGNPSGKRLPDKSIHPSSSFPTIIKSINSGLARSDQIATLERTMLPEEKWDESHRIQDWFVPIVADAEAGLGGTSNVYDLIENMIKEGVAGIHLEDQDSAYKKCGHMGGKVLVPTLLHVDKLRAARIIADVLDVPTVIIARTDANSATFLNNDIDERDKPFLSGERSREGFYKIKGGLEMAIARGLAFAPYAEMIWCETSVPDIDEARQFADAIHERYPGKLLSYNCSPSFPWTKDFVKKYGTEEEARKKIASFQPELAEMGYQFQFITLFGFHKQGHGMYELSREYANEGMPAFVRLQDAEFESAKHGYTGVWHQRFAGLGVFDYIDQLATGGQSSTGGMDGSTEKHF